MAYKARYLYSELSSSIEARKNCAECKPPNTEWFDKHTETIEKLVDAHMPHGSGFDSGTKIDLDASHAEKLVFHTSFHHMDENGFYDGWTEHTVTVTPSLAHSFRLRVSGTNRNDIKDYIHEQFSWALTQDVTYDLFIGHYPEFAITTKWENEDGTPSQCYMAWYVGEKRFWNNYSGARQYAAEQMMNKFYGRAA